MASLPRILTVDPTGRIPQQVRGAIDLMDRLIIQIDVPDGKQALEELKHAGVTVVISAWVTGDQMPGWALAASIKKSWPDTPVIILADVNDAQLDEETISSSPYVYLRRPFDIEQFFRVLTASLEGEDVFAALKPPATANTPIADVSYNPVPPMNEERARAILQKMLSELNAMGVLLCNRDGLPVLELGVIGLDRNTTATHLVKAVMANINIRDMIGGNAATLQFYDGEEYDVYVLSAGYHYFTVLVFKGQDGARQLGNVRLVGRRAAEDLVALMGMEAWLLRAVEQEEKISATPRRSEVVKSVTDAYAASRATDSEPQELARAEIVVKKDKTAEHQVIEVVPLMEAIADENFNLDDIFGVNPSPGEEGDFFSLENMEELANADTGKRGTFNWDDAVNSGLLKE